MLKGLIQMSKRVRNTFQVRVSQTGTITLPKGWMKENEIKTGDILTLVDLNDGVVGVRPQRSRFEGIAGKLAKEWQDSGVSLESMLDTLREVRAENIRKLS
jgi:bifunctional DNA-binding transcriptional regulator/antitoxin component of YhaV-PrlF toxin-antitoxin module